MRNLFLFKKDYNRENNLHYIFTKSDDFTAGLYSDSAGIIPFTSYRINNGRLLISLKTLSDMGVNRRQILYVADIEQDDVTSVHLMANFYHVRTSYDQSDYAVFEIIPDLWANAMPYAVFSDVHIIRCNRDIDSGRGIYDPVRVTTGRITYLRQGTENISDFSAVVLVSVVTSTQLFGQNPITGNFMLRLDLSVIESVVDAAYSNASIFDKIRFVVGGIFQVGDLIEPSANDAQVLRCWIVPKNVLSSSGLALAKVTTNSVFAPNAIIQNIPVLQSSNYNMSINMKGIVNYSHTWADYFPAYELGFGTYGHTAPIRRFTGSEYAHVRFMVTTNDVRVLFDNGGHQEDLSDNFELSLNINNQQGTAAQGMAQTSGKILGVLGKAAAGYVKYGEAGAIVGAGEGLLSLQSNTPRGVAAPGQGDAGSTYDAHSVDKLHFPFVVSAIESNEDEEELAYFNGATFDIYNSNFAAIEACNHLGSTQNTRTGTFLQADSIRLDGVDVSESEYIKAEFARGIWFKKV